MLILWGSGNFQENQKLKQQVDYEGAIWASTDTTKIPFNFDRGPQPQAEGALIIAMGNKPLKTLQQYGLVPKGRTITWCRYPRLFSLPNGAKVMVTFNAGIKDSDYAKYVDFRWDITLAGRYMRTGSFDPVVGDYEYVEHFLPDMKGIMAQFEATQEPVDVALDLETLGLDPYHPDAYIVAIQLSWREGHTSIVPFFSQEAEEHGLAKSNPTELYYQLRFFLTSEQISLRGANLKFDLHWLRERCDLKCTNFKFDTMLVGSLLDENRRNSLNTHAKWYLPDLGGYDDQFDADHDKSRMDKALFADPEGFKQYAGGDTDACLRVSKLMREELLQDDKLTKFYINVLHPAARAYEVVEQTGLLLDVPYYLELEYTLETELERLRKLGLSLLPWRMVEKHRKTGNLNLTKASLINDYMFSPQGLNLKPKMTTKTTGAPSTAAEHLAMFAESKRAGPFVKILQEYADISKTLSTYVIKRDDNGVAKGGFLFHMKNDCRFHPTHFLHNSGDGTGGTNTGRISVRDPAMQTVPKHTKWAKPLRRAFIAPPGMRIMANDYSQGELKIAACLAREKTMIAAYLAGADLHAVTGASMVDMTFEEFIKLKDTNPKKYATIRQRAKAGNFGFLYGMGAEGFVAYAAASYGVQVSLLEAEETRNAFFSTYSGLSDWHTEYKDYAREHLQVRSPLGRVRHLPMIASNFQDVRAKEERRAINAPVQSTLSDMSLWATAEMKDYPHSQVVAMIHDQLVSYVDEVKWEDAARYTINTMENLPFEKVGWDPQLKFTVDCEIGENLADVEEVKIAA